MDGIDQLKITVLPGGRVSRRDAAAYLGRKPKTLSMWASERRGPTPIMAGGRAFYSLADLEQFARGSDVAA